MPRFTPGRLFSGGLSLRAKSFLFVGFVALALTGALILLISTILFDSMGNMQNNLAKEFVDSVITQLGQIERKQRQQLVKDAVRDEFFDALKLKQREIFLSPGFKSEFSGQDIVILFDRQKNPFAWLLPKEPPGGGKGLPSYLKADELRHSGLLQDGNRRSDIIAFPDGLLILTAQPVTRSDGSGPSPGWLVYGVSLGKEWFDDIKELTGVTVHPAVSTGTLPGGSLLTGKTLSSDGLGTFRIHISHNTLSGNGAGPLSAVVQFDSPTGSLPAELRLTFPSAVYSAAVDLRDKLILSSIVGGAVFALVCLLAIEHIFIRKITRMDREFQALTDSEDAPGKLAESPNDEFGRLARSANRLLDSLRRRRMESENQEKLLAGVLDSASEGVMAFRSLRGETGAISDFILVLANKSAENFVNRKAEDMIGKCLLGLFPGSHTEGLFERYVRVVESGRGESLETFYGHENIRSWFHISAEPWTDGFVVTFEEITQRKRFEQELKASIEELERFNHAMLGRENRILEMKSEVNRLRERLGLTPDYRVDSLSDES